MARPDPKKTYHLRILNWNSYVGFGKHGRIKSPLFIKKPVDFFHSSRLDMDPDLYRFFDYLLYYASRQDTPGEVRGTAHGLSTACRRKAHGLPTAVRRLVDMQLIQDLSHLTTPLEEKRRDIEVVVSNKGNFDAEHKNPPKVPLKQNLSTSAALNDFWLIETWNQNCGELPKVTELEPALLERVLERQEKFPEREKWAAAIAGFSASDYALGKTDKKTFKSRFDFALKPGFLDKAASALKKTNNAPLIGATAAVSLPKPPQELTSEERQRALAAMAHLPTKKTKSLGGSADGPK